MLKIHNLLACLPFFSSLLAGCSQLSYTPLPTAGPPPTQQVIHAVITPSLRPLQPALWSCAEGIPNLAFFLEELPARAFEDIKADLFFRLGQPENLPPYTTQIGSEEISVILHPERDAGQYSAEELRQLFSGDFTRWEDIEAPVIVWTLPQGDEIRQVFEANILGPYSLTTQALLAPDAQAMMEGVASDQGAIGYVPSAWLDGRMRVPELEDSLRSGLRLPILAFSLSEPEGAVRSLLACLQSGEGQKILAEHYQPLSTGE